MTDSRTISQLEAEGYKRMEAAWLALAEEQDWLDGERSPVDPNAGLKAKKMRNPLHYSNDDKSPLIDLLNCIVCSQTMKIEKSSPDANGMDIIQYRCGRCDRIERVRLFRRTRDALG